MIAKISFDNKEFLHSGWFWSQTNIYTYMYISSAYVMHCCVCNMLWHLMVEDGMICAKVSSSGVREPLVESNSGMTISTYVYTAPMPGLKMKSVIKYYHKHFSFFDPYFTYTF